MKHVVLVGAGHVHMALLGYSERFRAAGIALTLVEPGSFWFGATITSLLTGRVAPASLRVSVRARCAAHGVRLCVDRAVGLDVRHRRVWLASGRMLSYDAVALNVGFEANGAGFDDRGAGVRFWHASSVKQLGQLHQALAEQYDRRPRIAVAGAGVTAVGVAASLSAATPCRLALYLPGARLLPEAPRGAGRRVARVLARRGVDLVPATAITGLSERAVRSSYGRRFAADHLVIADGFQGARFVHAGGLATTAGALDVGRRLHAPNDVRVFASGGCARLPGRWTGMIDDVGGQARILADNLIAGFARRPYKSYRRGWHARMLDLAEEQAVTWRGRAWCHGRMVARAKAHRDARLFAQLES